MKESAHWQKGYWTRLQRKRKYGLSHEDFESLIDYQEGKCAICKIDFKSMPKGACVDHCHVSGQIRGLLCSNCNFILGHAKDSIPILQGAIEYLLGSPIHHEQIVPNELPRDEELSLIKKHLRKIYDKEDRHRLDYAKSLIAKMPSLNKPRKDK